MKKQILYTGACMAAALFLGSCSEEFVEPTAQHSGITSLAAYFTSGPNNGKLAIDWKVSGNDATTDYVIPVPYYYPEESNNTTEQYMPKMKVVATLANNCSIDPPLTVLDLTKKNQFTYTNPYGERQQITISGQMTRSDKCAIHAFTVSPGDLTGIIDEDNKTISLGTFDNLSAVTAEVTLSPHATISPDPSQAHDFNTPFHFTVTADNGTSKADYTVVKRVPQKIENGYRTGSEKQLFENDMTTLGVTSADAVHPTLASVGSFVVLNLGDGTAPQYFKRSTGTRVGTINLGAANASGAITSDVAGNMIIANHADNGQTMNIYRTSDVTQAPQLLLSYNNALGVAIGDRLHVQGNLNTDAIITATPYGCQNAIRWTVHNGTVGAPENILFNGVNAWGDQDAAAKVVARSANTADGCFFSYYDSGNCPTYYAPAWASPQGILTANSDGNGWGYNTGAIDARDFNGARYLALFEIGYWPHWGLPGTVYLYDAGNPATISGTVDKSSALKYKFKITDLYGSVGFAAGGRTGDVLMTPSEDGYYMYIFYASNTHLSFGGYQIDCIKK